LAGSEYLQIVHGKVEGRPAIDLDLEMRVQAICRRAIGAEILTSAHDCAEGGLAVALAECSVQGNVGFHGNIALPQRWDAALFGERQSRIVVSLIEKDWPALQRMADESSVPLRRLGTTGGDRLKIARRIDLPLQEIGGAWREGLERAL
jgi:phosphoribosylformylglycinamidine synthase